MTDVNEFLSVLKKDLDKLNLAINALSNLAKNREYGAKRRGRPPGSTNKPKLAQVEKVLTLGASNGGEA
jgi:hypothetical protein